MIFRFNKDLMDENPSSIPGVVDILTKLYKYVPSQRLPAYNYNLGCWSLVKDLLMHKMPNPTNLYRCLRIAGNNNIQKNIFQKLTIALFFLYFLYLFIFCNVIIRVSNTYGPLT